jgi:hypothetical protein
VSEASTYGALHAGDVVLGVDNQAWGVVTIGIIAGGVFAVRLYRHGHSVTGYPARETPVFVIQRADTSAEARAWEAFQSRGIEPEIISESWET